MGEHLVGVELEHVPGGVDGHAAAERGQVKLERVAGGVGGGDSLRGREDPVQAVSPAASAGLAGGVAGRANAGDAGTTALSLARMLPLAWMIRPIVTGVSSLVKSSIGTRRPLSWTRNLSVGRSEM